MDPMMININGYDTYYTESKDNTGKHLLIAIPFNANKDISDICGQYICGHWIKQIDYTFINNTRFIKAYY